MIVECLSASLGPRTGKAVKNGFLILIAAKEITMRMGFWLGTLFSISLGMALASLPCRAQNPAPAPSASGAPRPSFEVASIKPNHSADFRMMMSFNRGRLTFSGVPIRLVISRAYDIKDFQISGGPSWIESERYDIDAKADEATAEELQKLPAEQAAKQMGLMLQSLLADRFQLRVSHATKELPIYALVVAKNGPKLHEAKAGDTYPNGLKGPDGRAAGQGGLMRMRPGQVIGQGRPLASLAEVLSQQLGRNVLDQTGLQGNYDFTLEWTPDPTPAGMMPMGPPPGGPGGDNAPPPEANGPSIFTAIQEQLGLKLEPTKGPVDVIVIDHIEKPSEN